MRLGQTNKEEFVDDVKRGVKLFHRMHSEYHILSNTKDKRTLFLNYQALQQQFDNQLMTINATNSHTTNNERKWQRIQSPNKLKETSKP